MTMHRTLFSVEDTDQEKSNSNYPCFAGALRLMGDFGDEHTGAQRRFSFVADDLMMPVTISVPSAPCMTSAKRRTHSIPTYRDTCPI